MNRSLQLPKTEAVSKKVRTSRQVAFDGVRTVWPVTQAVTSSLTLPKRRAVDGVVRTRQPQITAADIMQHRQSFAHGRVVSEVRGTVRRLLGSVDGVRLRTARYQAP